MQQGLDDITSAEAREDWLPPGQAVTDKFPVVGETAPAPGLDAHRCRVEVAGLVKHARSFCLDELLALPQSTRSVDI
ncbi:MAG: hypothetical protein OSA97_18410, partial [Nevskia sp.]|nr:hypothetical protein [Nevskia sp.]